MPVPLLALGGAARNGLSLLSGRKQARRARAFVNRQFGLANQSIDNSQAALLEDYANATFDAAIGNVRRQALIQTSSAERGLAGASSGRARAIATQDFERGNDRREFRRDNQLNKLDIARKEAELQRDQALDRIKSPDLMDFVAGIGGPIFNGFLQAREERKSAELRIADQREARAYEQFRDEQRFQRQTISEERSFNRQLARDSYTSDLQLNRDRLLQSDRLERDALAHDRQLSRDDRNYARQLYRDEQSSARSMAQAASRQAAADLAFERQLYRDERGHERRVSLARLNNSLSIGRNAIAVRERDDSFLRRLAVQREEGIGPYRPASSGGGSGFDTNNEFSDMTAVNAAFNLTEED